MGNINVKEGISIMKNRIKLRSMIIDEKEYLWSYNYDDMDFSNYPYSYYLFVPKENKRLTVRVLFTKYAPPMKLSIYKDEGTACLYKGQQIILNMCRPYFAKQIMEYVFENYCNDNDTGEIEIKDGEKILEEMGYSDFY